MKQRIAKLREKVSTLQDKDALSKEYLLESVGVVVSTALVGREFGGYIKYPLQGALLGAGVGMLIVSGVSARSLSSKLTLQVRPLVEKNL